MVGPITAASIGVTTTTREFIAASVTGDIYIEAFAGNLEIGSFDGDLTVGNYGGASRTPGDLIIGDDYDGTILITDEDGFNGTVRVDGDFTGYFSVVDDMFGSIEICGTC